MKKQKQINSIYNLFLVSSKPVTFTIALFLASQIISCHSFNKNSPSKSSTANNGNSPNVGESGVSPGGKYSWPQQMQQLTNHLVDLLPTMTDPKAYSDTEFKKLFENQISELKSIAHNINENTPAPDQDPTLKLIGRRFESNLKLSLESFETGHVEFARTVFKNALAQCVQCHTRTNVGPALAQPQFVNALQKVAIVERVQFLIASRYFDNAMNEITQALQNGSSLSIVAWQKLVQMGLIINVRYRNDVKKSEQFIQLLSQNKDVPFFIKRHLPYWQQSLKDWNRKPKLSPSLASAEQIIKKAETAQKASHSEGGTIDFLRGAGLLHQFLAKSQTPSTKSEALYQLGTIYENVGEIGAWSMNEDYYELCIRTSPHSEIAKKCFERFKESTISGFSGTSGLHLPEDIQKRMNELRAMAL